MLDKLVYKADLAADGQQAVEAVRAKTYDLILMDIQMPIMDGLSATHKIRELGDNREKPFIIGLSAHALKESRDEAIASGMNAYLTKPLKMPDLIDALKAAATQPGV